MKPTEIPHLDEIAAINAYVFVAAKELVALRDELAHLRAAKPAPKTTRGLFDECGDFDYLIYAVAHLEHTHEDVFEEAQTALDGVKAHIEATK